MLAFPEKRILREEYARRRENCEKCCFPSPRRNAASSRIFTFHHILAGECKEHYFTRYSPKNNAVTHTVLAISPAV